MNGVSGWRSASTHAIIGCALAAGVSSATAVRLFKVHGVNVFRRKLPSKFGKEFLVQWRKRPSDLALGEQALREALTEVFQGTTIGELWGTRQIALAIPAINICVSALGK